MTDIPSLPERFVNITNIEKSAYIPQLRENLFEKHEDKDGNLVGKFQRQDTLQPLKFDSSES